MATPISVPIASLLASVSASPVIKSALPAPVIAAYSVFGALALAVYHLVADGQFSSVMTLSALVQGLGVAFLCIQVLSSGSAEGISAKALTFDAFALAFRLMSTTWLNGYLPADASGDYVYQFLEVGALLMLLYLLYSVLVVHRLTYQAEEDSFCIWPVLLTCLGLAALLHGDMNDLPLFDTLWMAGLFTGVVSVLPQLALIVRTGGRVEALTSHYIAALALSRVFSGMFMWVARNHITCQPWFGSFEHAIVAILAAHLLHMILLGDFTYYYIRALVDKGASSALQFGPELLV